MTANRTLGRQSSGLLRRSADFRRLWLAATVSQFGTQISTLAIPLVAVVTLHASAVAVGGLTALEFAAFFLIGLPAGSWCDRMRRRPIMIASDLCRFALLASIPLAAWAGHLTVAQLLVVVFLQGVATTFFDVADQSYLPSLVGPNDLVAANAQLQASTGVAQVSGPALAGLLVGWLTAATAVLFDAVSYLFSAVGVAAIRHREPGPHRVESAGMVAQIGEGLRVVFGNVVLRTLAVATATANFFMAVFTAVIVVFLARTLQLSPSTIGLLSDAR